MKVTIPGHLIEAFAAGHITERELHERAQVLALMELGASNGDGKRGELSTSDAVRVRAAFHDEAGVVLLEEVEQEGRRWVRRPDGEGGYVPNAEGVPRVLWNLPRLREHLAAGRHAGPVYVTEGTSDARALEDYLAEHGLPGAVTTNMFGALSWLDEYTDVLRGAAEVVATVDNDEAGFKRAALLERELGPVVEVLRIVRTPIDEKGADLRDHLAAGLTLADLELVELTEPGGSAQPAEKDEGDVPQLLPAVPLESFIREKDEAAAAPLVGNESRAVVARASLTVVGGVGGCGKTTYTLDAVAHFAAGVSWREVEVERALRILLIDVEGPREPYRQKLERKVAAWTGPAFAQNVFVLDGSAWGRFTFDDERYRRALVATCRELEIDLVVANPLGRLGMRGGGTPDEVGAFVEHLRECGLWDGLAFWLLHHFNRGLSRDVLLRLSGAWDRDADTIIGLAREGPRRTKLTWAKVRWAHDGGPEELTEVLEWDVETLGYRKVAESERAAATLEEIRERVLDHLVESPGEHSTTDVRGAVKGDDKLIDEALRELFEAGLVGLAVGATRKRPLTVGEEDWANWHRLRTPKYWEALNHAGSEVGESAAPTVTDLAASPPDEGGSRCVSPAPIGGDTSTDYRPGGGDDEEIERLAEVSRAAQEDDESAGASTPGLARVREPEADAS